MYLLYGLQEKKKNKTSKQTKPPSLDDENSSVENKK